MNAAEFTKKIKELVELARKNKDVLSIKEINDYFKGIELNADQMDMVYQYLEDNKIYVLQISEDQIPLAAEFDDD